MSSRIQHGGLLTALSIFLTMVFALSACSPTPPSPAPTSAPAPAQPATGPAPTQAAAPAAPAAPAPAAPAPAAPAKLSDAPSLADDVKAGKLPPVQQRLPENPYVEPTAELGKYGGVWHRGFLGPSDFNGVVRVMNDGLVRFSVDGTKVEMKLAESVTPSTDFTQWTIKLRKGSKWSDGKPFTADDIMFWWKDIINNKE